MGRLKWGLVIVIAALVAVALPAAGATTRVAPGGRVEVVVTLAAPPLAFAAARDRELAAAARPRGRLNVRAPASVAYTRKLAAAQRDLAARILRAVPGAQVRWRYSIVLNGMAVVVPRSQATHLAGVPGVARVWPSHRYHALLDRTPREIGATTLWGPQLSTAGEGMKVGVLDQGIDQRHPFFGATGFSYPPGFPKGNTAFTTPKVIVARSFPPPGGRSRAQTLPFTGLGGVDDHGTHVAGIAAGDADTQAQGVSVSGVAPRAYLGNYKVLTTPTPGFGLDGNSPEIAAAVEAAVKDGMDVINLSLGEPEIEPGRDLVVAAINAAAEAGVVPVVAAGNDYGEFGRGSIGSPGSAAQAISAAAATGGHGTGSTDVIAGFSSAGPTPFSHQFKPDVTAPGVGVLSSVPRNEGLWDEFSGTSMSSPHVAGAVALLRERHPGWTVDQIRSALVTTGDPVYSSTAKTTEVSAAREGGGRIDLVAADQPLLFARPATLSFGLVRAAAVTREVQLSDAGGGAGTWSVRVELQSPSSDLVVTAPSSVAVPAALTVAAANPRLLEREVTGFVILTRGAETRRIPLWFRAARPPRLAEEPRTLLSRPGVYRGNTRGKPSLVSAYRYPDEGGGASLRLGGPEQVFRIRIVRPVTNFGVAVVSRGRGVKIEPRVVLAGDENRLAGYVGLPLNLNPYLPRIGRPQPVVGVDRPAPREYDIVFDTPDAAHAGRFTFRLWINDAKPPVVRLRTRSVRSGQLLVVAVADRGSGVDRSSLAVAIDGQPSSFAYRGGRVLVRTSGLGRGRHTLRLSASDYQEAKNMENVPPILPNTRVLQRRFLVR